MNMQGAFITAPTHSVFKINGETPCNVQRERGLMATVKTLDELTLTVPTQNLVSRTLSDREIFGMFSTPCHMKFFVKNPRDFRPQSTCFSPLNRLHFDREFGSNCMLIRASDVSRLGERQASCYNLLSFILGDVLVRFDEGGVFRCQCFVVGRIPFRSEGDFNRFSRLAAQYCAVFGLDVGEFTSEVWGDLMSVLKIHDKFKEFEAANQLARKMCQFAVIDEQPQEVLIIVADAGEFAGFETQIFERAVRSCYQRNVKIADVQFSKTEGRFSEIFHAIIDEFFDEPYYDVICRFESVSVEQLVAIMKHQWHYEMFMLSDLSGLGLEDDVISSYFNTEVDGFWMDKRTFAARKGQILRENDQMHLVVEFLRKNGVEMPFQEDNAVNKYKLDSPIAKQTNNQEFSPFVEKSEETVLIQPPSQIRAKSRPNAHILASEITIDANELNATRKFLEEVGKSETRRAQSAASVHTSIKVEFVEKKTGRNETKLLEEFSELHAELDKQATELENRLNSTPAPKIVLETPDEAFELVLESNGPMNAEIIAEPVILRSPFEQRLSLIEAHNKAVEPPIEMQQPPEPLLITEIEPIVPDNLPSIALSDVSEYELFRNECQRVFTISDAAEFCINKEIVPDTTNYKVSVGNIAYVQDQEQDSIEVSDMQLPPIKASEKPLNETNNILLEELAMDSEKEGTNESLQSSSVIVEREGLSAKTETENRNVFYDYGQSESVDNEHDYIAVDVSLFLDQQVETVNNVDVMELVEDLKVPGQYNDIISKTHSVNGYNFVKAQNEPSSDEIPVKAQAASKEDKSWLNASAMRLSTLSRAGNSNIIHSVESCTTSVSAIDDLSRSCLRKSAADQEQFDFLQKLQALDKRMDTQKQRLALFAFKGISQGLSCAQSSESVVGEKPTIPVETNVVNQTPNIPTSNEKGSFVDSLFQDFEKRKQEKIAIKREEKLQKESSLKEVSFGDIEEPSREIFEAHEPGFLTQQPSKEGDKELFEDYLQEYSVYLDKLSFERASELDKSSPTKVKQILELEITKTTDQREPHGFWKSVEAMKERIKERGSRPSSILSD